MARDTVKAYQHERAYLEALERAPEDDKAAIKAYVDALLAAMHLVNRSLVKHTAGGSEYWDERGSVYGSLLATERITERMKSNWEAFLDERRKNRAQPY